MRLNRRLAGALLLAALGAALPAAPRAAAQATAPTPINFSAYYSIGDSLAAGYRHNSLVETHQGTPCRR